MDYPAETIWQSLIGQEVVLDLASAYVVLGQLLRAQCGYLELAQVDVHDLRDTQTTREKYVLDCRLHGIRPNRSQAWVSLTEVVCVSRLMDVLAD